jgi:arylsulfatase A-like enzyme
MVNPSIAPSRPLGAGRAFAAALLGLAVWAIPSAAKPAEPAPPNILFILMDDMGWTDAGVLGSDFYETPNIDRLVRLGMRFNAAYSSAANCTPTRASLMTGLYPPRHGIYNVPSVEGRGETDGGHLLPVLSVPELPASFQTIAESLRAAGYATFHGGKWNLGSGATGPEAQGFDFNVGGGPDGAPPGGSYFGPWKMTGLENAPVGAHLGDYVTDRTIEFLKRPKTAPFFAYVPYYDVHTPLQAKPELLDKYEAKLARNTAAGIVTEHRRAVYGAMMETVDANIGRLLQALEQCGQARNTVVIFTSDNGGFGGATSMRPLRGIKGMFYEGGIRVPLAITWPGRIAAGSSSDVPVNSVDFFPTLLDLAGIKADPSLGLDGVSLRPLLEQSALALARDALFWHFPSYLKRVSKGFEGDARNPGWRATPLGVIRQGEWKLIEYFEDGSVELFNLKDDIGERHNLAATHPEKARALQARLAAWRVATGAPVPTQRNLAYSPEQAPQPRP